MFNKHYSDHYAGIGGDYPLSSIITSEFATTKWRGAMMAAVFAMQGFGQLAGAIVMVCLCAGFQGTLQNYKSYAVCQGDCAVAVDKMWRILVGFGAVPACIALYYRLTIPETPRYTFDVARDVERAGVDVQAYMVGKHEGRPDEIRRLETLRVSDQLTTPKAGWLDFFRYYSQWKNGSILLGTAGSWFVLDVAFYGLGLNSSTVLTAIGYAGGSNVYQLLYNLAAGNCVLICAGAIPGYWFTVATVDTVGRKPIQMMGFFCLTLLFMVWGFDFFNISPKAMFAIYVLCPILLQLWSQRHNLYRSWRVLPNTLPLHLARYFCRLWQAWFHYCPGRYCTSTNKGCRSWCNWRSCQPMAKQRHEDLRLLHVARLLPHPPHPGNQTPYSREIGR